MNNELFLNYANGVQTDQASHQSPKRAAGSSSMNGLKIVTEYLKSLNNRYHDIIVNRYLWLKKY
jgi:hypothetical protein